MASCEVSIHLQTLKQESLYANTSLSYCGQWANLNHCCVIFRNSLLYYPLTKKKKGDCVFDTDNYWIMSHLPLSGMQMSTITLLLLSI